MQPQELIQQAKEQYALDYKDDASLDIQLAAFEEGMITAFTMLFERSLRGSISFEIEEGESNIHF